jgi:hypothetical protein
MVAPLNRESSSVDQFQDIAMFHISLWDLAFRKQLERVCGEGELSERRLVDFVFLVISLHNFRLSLQRYRDEAIANISNGRGVRDIRQVAKWASSAVEVFEQGLPSVTEIRNVFSHFEEYAYGSGRLQRRSGVPISVLSGGTHVFTVKDADNCLELDLDVARTVMDSVRKCLIEVLVYAD